MVPPVDAAKVAASQDIRIYTIAIGDPASVGEEALDIETLQRVSELTGGSYFQAFDQRELAEAYLAIGELEPELYETISFRPRQSLHWVPVGLALVFYLIYHSIAAWQTRRRLRSARAS
jgi:Ca-activated chloride channel family protein